jgi:hypothetical protein
MLPPEYDVRLDAPMPGAPSRHYTGPIRHLMYREGMSRLVKNGFPGNPVKDSANGSADDSSGMR